MSHYTATCSTNTISVSVTFEVFLKAILPLALVRYEMNITNSYPMHAHRIINYTIIYNQSNNRRNVSGVFHVYFYFVTYYVWISV